MICSSKQFAAVKAEQSTTGIATRNLVKSHVAVKMYQLPNALDGIGPTKSSVININGSNCSTEDVHVAHHMQKSKRYTKTNKSKKEHEYIYKRAGKQNRQAIVLLHCKHDYLCHITTLKCENSILWAEKKIEKVRNNSGRSSSDLFWRLDFWTFFSQKYCFYTLALLYEICEST